MLTMISWDAEPRTRSALNMAIEIVSFPIQNGDFPEIFVCLPEGTLHAQ
jgi:hypothetical protein